MIKKIFLSFGFLGGLAFSQNLFAQGASLACSQYSEENDSNIESTNCSQVSDSYEKCRVCCMREFPLPSEYGIPMPSDCGPVLDQGCRSACTTDFNPNCATTSSSVEACKTCCDVMGGSKCKQNCDAVYNQSPQPTQPSLPNPVKRPPDQCIPTVHATYNTSGNCAAGQTEIQFGTDCLDNWGLPSPWQYKCVTCPAACPNVFRKSSEVKVGNKTCHNYFPACKK